MSYALTLIEQILIMFLLLMIGFVLYKIKMISDDTNKQLTKIVLNLVGPAVILSAYQMEYDPAQAKNMLWGFLLSTIGISISIFISHLVKMKGEKSSIPTERFAIIFTNCGFIGLPLLSALFGKLGVFYCNTYITVFNIFVWTYGMLLMRSAAQENEHCSFLKNLKNLLTPTMISIVIGLILYFGRISLPQPILKTIDYVASMNTPLAMIVSGVYIAQSNLIASLKKLRIYYLMALKCFVVPIAVLFVLALFPLDEVLKTSIILLTACPTAANTMLFAANYGGDAERGANVFTLTTLFSIINLPVIIMIMQFI